MMSFAEDKRLVQPPRWDANHLRHLALQSPSYFAAFARGLAHSCRDYAVSQAPTEQAIVTFILETSLVMLVRPLGDGAYELRYEKSRIRKLDDARRFSTLEVAFTKTSVRSFVLDGEPVEDLEEMISALVVFLSCGVHTKSHVMGERSVQEIERKGVKALQRSTWSTLSTDHAVLNSALSPIRNDLYGFHMDIDSLIDESKNRNTIQHRALRAEPPPSQFLTFLMRGRALVIKHLAAHGLDVDPECLFNAMLVHPVDHYMAYRSLQDIRFSISDKKTPVKVFGAFMFRHMFLRGVLNPVAPNLLSTIDEPFYQGLYRDLVAVDPELAAHATACVMY